MMNSPRRLFSLLAVALAAAWFMPNHAAAQPDDDSVLSATITPQRTKAAPGDRFALAVILDFAEHWHAWPNKPVLPKELEDVTAKPTTITIPTGNRFPDGVVVHLDAAQWPAPASIKTAAFSGSPITILAYHDRTVIFVPITVAPDAKPGKVEFNLNIDYQACDDSTCKQPDTLTPAASFEIVAAGDAVADAPDQSIFKGFDASELTGLSYKPTSQPSPPNQSGPALSAQPRATPTPSTSSIASTNLLGIPLPNPHSPLGALILFVVSAIGGAVLNLTPCVLPVIPIKVMTLVQHAGSHGRALVLGLWMFLGVIAFWVLVGLPMAISIAIITRSGQGAVFDPSQAIFGTWWVTLLLGLIIASMGLGIMGLFTINLPQSAYLINPKADTAWGSFIFGLMTALLGLPCFGFVAGGLLAGAVALGSVLVMVVFAGMGFGMALPYLILAARPGLVDKIPRTGPSSELVKQVMGLLLLAAAAFFLATGFKTLLVDKPYLDEALKWWVVAFFILLAAGWLTIRTIKISRSTPPKIVMPILAAAGLFVAVAFAWSSTKIDREDYFRAHGNGQRAATLITGAWIPYSADLFSQARAANHIIVVDFTADWCINCKVLKRAVLDSEAVRTRFQMADVVLFEVDLTSNEAPGWQFLQSLGQTGVPTLAIYGPAADKPLIYNAYTPDVVLAAINKAKGNSQASAPPASPDVTPRTP